MLVEKFFQTAASLSSITDQSVLLAFLNLAAKEMWSSVDFPDTLREESLNPYSPATGHITLPPYIKAIRGVMPCGRTAIDVYAQPAYFNDDFWQRSPWVWRVIKRTPMQRNIEEASQLTIKKTNPDSTAEVIVTLSGKSDVAALVTEVVEIPSGTAELLTVNTYEDIQSLSKDRLIDTDLEVYDAAGNKVAVIPNNYDEVQCLLVQIQDKCTCTICASCECVRVLYKPVLPPFWSVTDSIPSGMEDALLLKFREWLDLFTEDKIERADIMNRKAADLLSREAYDKEKGQIRPFPVKRNTFVRFPGVQL